jgi:MFS family permease
VVLRTGVILGSVGPKWRRTKVDLPAPDGPTSNTSAGSGTTSLIAASVAVYHRRVEASARPDELPSEGQPPIEAPVNPAAVAEALVPPILGRVTRPMAALPMRQLLSLSIYWLGINAIWTGLHVLVLPKRMEALFGPGNAGLALGMISLAGVVTAIVVQPTVGAISDYTQSRWGRRKPYIVIGGLLDLLFLWALASAQTYLAILLALVLLQFSSNLAQGPFQGYVPDLVPGRQVGRASALMGLMIILGGMAGVGIVALGYLQLTPAASEEAVRATFFWPTLALGLLEAITMVVLALTVDEGRPAPSRQGRSWLRVAGSAWGTDLLHERSYLWLIVSRLLFLAVPGVVSAYGVFMLERSFGLSPANAGPLLFVIAAVVAVSTAAATGPAAWLSDRYGRKPLIYGAFALGVVGVAMLASAPWLELAIAALVPIGVSAGAFLSVDWALMTDIIPKATTGRYMGISNVATASAGPLGLTVAGVVLAIATNAGLTHEAPRLAIGAMLLFIATAAVALRKVDPRRRDA